MSLDLDAKMTALADKVRELSGTTTPKSIDSMTTDINAANDEVSEQASIIAQIKSVVDNLPEAGSNGDSNGNNVITVTIRETCGSIVIYYDENKQVITCPTYTTTTVSALNGVIYSNAYVCSMLGEYVILTGKSGLLVVMFLAGGGEIINTSNSGGSDN